MSKEPLKVDLEELMCAMQDGSGVEWFLDLETGEAVPKMDAMTIGEEDANDELIESNPDRFHEIRSVYSSRSYQIMEEFVWRLPEAAPKYKLGLALQGRKPFRAFKDTLHDLGPVRDEWFKFQEDSFKVIVKEWLEDEEIDAILVQNGEPLVS